MTSKLDSTMSVVQDVSVPFFSILTITGSSCVSPIKFQNRHNKPCVYIFNDFTDFSGLLPAYVPLRLIVHNHLMFWHAPQTKKGVPSICYYAFSLVVACLHDVCI